MFKFLTKNKQGFTIVELVVVLLLLSLGVLALANMFRVTYRAFEKSEERSIKQEAVKTVAESLRSGQTNVASAMSADIFSTTAVLPKVSADTTYSYLYFEPHYACSNCGEDWDTTNNSCTVSCSDEDSKGKVDGYFMKCLNKGVNPSAAFQLSDVPIHVEFAPMLKDETQPGSATNNLCGVLITVSALEDDFEYESIDKDEEGTETVGLNMPISDDKYYTLDVAYHFPNMILAENDITVNYKGEKITETNTYDAEGKKTTTPTTAVNEGGVVLRVYSDSIISADSANTSILQPSLCFIATASYGHDSGEVGLLCKFRDECLLTNPLGTAFVNAYYKLSPPIADFIAESEPLKAAVRVALKPLVAVATNALNEDVAEQNAVWFAVFMLCGAGATAVLIKIDKRKKKVK